MRTLNTVVAVALLSGAGVTIASAAVAMTCDTDSDGYMSQTEASTCTDQRFEEISAGQQNLTQEQFSKALPEAENPEQVFTEVDQDGDGKISLEEWRNWHQQGFTAATEASGGMMPVADYENMITQQQYVRPTGVGKPGQNKQ
jgi:Ca2+-binding EF-hand superfamily protein